MRKIILTSVLCLISFTIVNATASTIAYANIDAKAAILIEAENKKIITAQNEHEQLSPASVTKVMTILLTYESLQTGRIKADDVVTISAHAASMGGSQIFLEQGQRQSVSDLLKSVIIASANDSSVALAEHIAGTEEAFVILMNERAKELGMENTTFKNATGLDAEGHLTTAYDISLMSAELITKHSQVSEIANTWQDTIIHRTAKGEKEFGLTNTNKLIRHYDGLTGLKTGSTSEALFCMAASAQRDGLELVSVILGSPTGPIRFQEAKKLLDYGFANFQVKEADPFEGSISVHKGELDFAPVATENTVNLTVPKGREVIIEEEIILPKFINAPMEQGENLGEIIYKIDNEEIARANLVLAQTIEKAGIFHNFQKLLK
ncbi:MAG: D-alanyl-D-alanine carboxypeptidase [Defluviitaleaceae bacterium]|nr:D-alanyl-D-alanine carboxypeptidase [Defluviitaleaceae bacterium]